MRNEPESKLLRRKEESLVRRDVLVHEPRVLEAVREAVEEGLTPSGFDVTGDAVILRLERNEDRNEHATETQQVPERQPVQQCPAHGSHREALEAYGLIWRTLATRWRWRHAAEARVGRLRFRPSSR